ncbi:MAG: metal ABC transporter permease [Gammaproteobacteria bacterium]|nr:MAG: metal ABC transporter permease [Gammaproteobacteria bacterium]
MTELPELAGIILPALLAGLLVLLTHVPLGREVLARGIIFLDIAVAQIAAFGVLLAERLGLGGSDWQVQLMAAGSALAGALALQWTERHLSGVQEAVIGSVFVLAATAGLILIAGDPHGAEHVTDLLSGQVLWAGQAQLLALAAVSLPVALVWLTAPQAWRRRLFYPLFAVTITASVQLVGVYLVFSSLILPALAIRGLGRRALPAGWALGLTGYAAGLILSALFDWPAGPVIVWSLALLALPMILIQARAKRAG